MPLELSLLEKSMSHSVCRKLILFVKLIRFLYKCVRYLILKVQVKEKFGVKEQREEKKTKKVLFNS